MTQNVALRLLVLGNGFDLKCGLQSKFEDYYNNRKDMTVIFDKMNKVFNEENPSTDVLKNGIIQKIRFKGRSTYANLEKIECK